MFENIGGKIKALSKAICWLGIIASVIIAIILWSTNSYRSPTIGIGFGVLIGGCVFSYLGSMASYAFGELVENSTRQVEQNNKAAQEQKELINQLQSLIEAKKLSSPDKKAKETDDISLNMIEL